MPTVQPFKGIVYNPQKSDYQEVTCPPYDVISPEFQEALYQKHPYNAIRLELPKEQNRYEMAKERWIEWQDQEILSRDDRSAMYVYDQTFTTKSGKTVTRKGFLARIKVQEFAEKAILPHERTLPKARTDRMAMFTETAANFSPIFMLYNDPTLLIDDLLAETRDTIPFLDVIDYQQAHNVVWRLRNSAVLEKITHYFQSQKLYIADGHHRYETALDYAHKRAAENPNHTGNEAYNFILCYFTNMDDPDLVIYPTYRLVHSVSSDLLTDLSKKLPSAFDVTTFSDETSAENWLHEKETSRFILVGNTSNTLSFSGLEFTGNRSLFSDVKLPESLLKLDVTILHQLIISKFLDINQEAQDQQKNIYYSKDWKETISDVKNGKALLAFLMNSTPVSSVTEVCNSGEVMPQKSTFFYPKIITGIVFHDLNGE